MVISMPGYKINKWQVMVLVVLSSTVIGIGLRMQQVMGALWYDEAFSAWLATLPRLDMLIEATAADAHPPAYYMLLWIVNQIGGHSEIALRFPSYLAGLAVCLLAGQLAISLGWRPDVAILTIALLMLSPQQIYYSTEARNYEMVTLGVMLAAVGLVQRRYWLAVLGSLLAVYLHHIAGIFVAAVWLATICRDWRYWLAGVLAAVLMLPNVAFLLHQAGNITDNYWMPPLSSPGRLLSVLDDLYWFQAGTPLALATAVVSTIILVLVLADGPHRAVRLLWLAVFLPFGLLTVISLVWQPILVDRSMAPAAPFWAMLVAYTISQSWRRLAAIGALGGAVLTATLAMMLVGVIGRGPVDTALAGSLRQYDAIYHANVGSYVVWKYYLPDVPQYVWPQSTSLSTTLSDTTRASMGMDQIDWQFVQCNTLVNDDGPRPLRRWAFIYFHNPATLPGEMEFVSKTLQTTPYQKIKPLRDDNLTDSWLIELTPDCVHGK